MPTLQFKGKNIIWNHHLAIPYHTLDEDEQLGFKQTKGEGNLIIEGDNLIALKALIPIYGGKVKCIYIDPPYNTGTENWVYNDKVNSPMIKEWLGKTVAKDDLTRHEKWLCMMTPRLKLLRDLLNEEGVIFISCDDNELHNLKCLMNEIFLEDNFVGTLIWRKKQGGGQTDSYFVTEHEYILVYRKSVSFQWFDELIEIDKESFKHEDKDGKYNLIPLAKWGNAARRIDRPKMYFPIYTKDSKKVTPIAPDGSEGRWRVGKLKMDELINDELVIFEKRKSKTIAFEKIYYEEDSVKKVKERSIIYELANTGDGTKQLTELFGKKDIFHNPKPVDLIKFLIEYTTKKDSIVLDSFAGSGTTAHAVLDLNKEDNGKRQFVLVQMTEATKEEPKKNVCKEITTERVKRAIKKYSYEAGYSYMKIGTVIDTDSMLEGRLPTYKQFAKYVYFLCTGANLEKIGNISEKDYYVGEDRNIVVYLLYSQDYNKLTNLALKFDFAQTIKKKHTKKRVVVYAPACFLDDEYLQVQQIEFVNIPYNLFVKD